MLHTHCNNEFFTNSITMNAQIELNSISMSKNDPKIIQFEKYDVEANIEEIDNSENQSLFKYAFTALSNPKNVRLAIEGIARISGDSSERNEILNKDENDVPKILTMIYHELFPTFFLLSKSLNVSCPPITIGSMGNTVSKEGLVDPMENSADIVSENSPQTDVNPNTTAPESTIPAPVETTIPEPQTPPVETSDITQPTV
jgi:hypothetical protein